MKIVLVGSRKAARAFTCSEPYAMISFCDTERWYGRTAPRILRPSSFRGRIIIGCDDVLEDSALSQDLSVRSHVQHPYRAMTEAQAQRVARFVARVAGHIDTLFIHCRLGHSRSAAAGLAIAEAYGVPIRNVEGEPFEPNSHIRRLVAEALRADCDRD